MSFLAIPYNYRVSANSGIPDSGIPTEERDVFGSTALKNAYPTAFLYRGLLSYVIAEPYHASGVTDNSGYYTRYYNGSSFSWRGLNTDMVDDKHAYGTMNSTSNSTVDPTTSSNIVDHINYLYTTTSGLASGKIWREEPILDILITPPVVLTTGDRYAIGASATADWSGQDGDIAEWNGSTWDFTTPSDGWTIINLNDSKPYTYNSLSSNFWVQSGADIPVLTSTTDGIVNQSWFDDLNDVVVNTENYLNDGLNEINILNSSNTIVGTITTEATDRTISIKAGTNITLAVDEANDLITINATSTTSIPGGSINSLQFNSTGSFNGTSITYDVITDSLNFPDDGGIIWSSGDSIISDGSNITFTDSYYTKTLTELVENVGLVLTDGLGTTANADSIDLGGELLDKVSFTFDSNNSLIEFGYDSGTRYFKTSFIQGTTFTTIDNSYNNIYLRSVNSNEYTSFISFQPIDTSNILSIGVNNTTYGGVAKIIFTTSDLDDNITIDGDTNTGFRGIEYKIDYSDNYSDRSLVDKEYVLDQLSTINVTTGPGLTNDNNIISLGGQMPTIAGESINIQGTNIDNFFNLSENYTGNAAEDLQLNFQSSYSGTSTLTIGSSFNVVGISNNIYATSLTQTNTGGYSIPTTKEIKGFGTFIESHSLNDPYSTQLGILSNRLDDQVTDGGHTIGAGSTAPYFKGIEYLDDYSSNYTDRSLVDKEYVDSLIIAAGNTTASNYGTTGVGLYDSRLALDLRFKNIDSPSESIVITPNETNHTVELEVSSQILDTLVSKTNENLPVYSQGIPLYNWYSVNTGKLAPTGWSIPSQSNIQTLIDYLGGDTVAGGHLKEEGTTNWNAPNTGADNTSGFTALPIGIRNSVPVFVGEGSFSYYWSSTQNNSTTSYELQLTSMLTSADNIYANPKICGRLVRCFRTTDPGVSTITDIDGNIYDIIQIGTQWWLQQDLKTTRYNDGEVIPNITDNTTWINLTTGALCYYNNDINTYRIVLEDETGNIVKIDKSLILNEAIVGGTKTKITYDSKGLVTSGLDATTADIADSTNKRYQTNNQQTYNDATSSIQTQLNGKASFVDILIFG
jgi:uncharacterized protein (TIGR02145 family)